MANHPKNFAPQGYEHTGRAIRFLLYPNGTGTPTVQGMGVSAVSRSDTGEYLVTLQDSHYKMTEFNHSLNCAAGSNNRSQGGTISNLGTNNPVVFYIHTRSATANVDITAGAHEFISVSMVFDDSDVVLG